MRGRTEQENTPVTWATPPANLISIVRKYFAGKNKVNLLCIVE